MKPRGDIDMTLDKLKPHESAKITAVGGSGALRHHLLDMGLTPQTEVTLQKVAPMGDPVQFELRGYELTLRLDEARKIEVGTPYQRTKKPSAGQVRHRPMKLAAMEGVYNGKNGQELIAFGILNPDKKYDNDEKEFLFDIPIPKLLSILATREIDGFVPGINDIINGGYVDKNLKGEEIIALSAQEKMERGRLAIAALADFNTARKDNDTEAMNEAKARLEANYEYFGYGYIDSGEQLIPHVPFVFYSFHIMIILGGYFLLFFIFILVLSYKEKLQKLKWVLWIAVLTIPLGYVCLESGWIVAEMGRQPWVIQDIMPTFAAISNIEVASVQTTFWMFAVLFTVLLIAEVGIMLKQIKKGTEQK